MRVIMSTPTTSPDNSRSGVSPSRPKARDTKDIPCRNITIYGHCRFEKDGSCNFKHDLPKPSNTPSQTENAKTRLKIDSPSFAPLQPVPNGSVSTTRSTALSPKAGFMYNFGVPGIGYDNATMTPPPYPTELSSEWGGPELRDYLHHGQMSDIGSYDPFTIPTQVNGMGRSNHHTPYNSYAPCYPTVGPTSYFARPPQYHLYFPMAPHRENLHSYQRTVHDFFIPDDFREDLQRKSEAALHISLNSPLPTFVDEFHSLVLLESNIQKSASLCGYSSSVYKAVSRRDGNTYALRRLENCRLTNEKSMGVIKRWKKITHSGITTIHDAFTSGAFGDRSLVIVTDYHPLSKSISEQHLSGLYSSHNIGRGCTGNIVPENVIWSYIVQIASTLKAIHNSGLAARVLHPSKIILTSKNRIRLSACAILDLVQYDLQRSISELQVEDLVNFGQLIFNIAKSSAVNMLNPMDHISRSYSDRLRDCMTWLLSAATPSTMSHNLIPTGPLTKNIDAFLCRISDVLVTALNSTLHADDTLNTNLARELENGRLVRLIAKLNFINERPEFDHQPHWSETGERYYLKLFRDYVFHQVDSLGRPAIDLGHVINCMNKLDAGSEEQVTLVSRDEQNMFIVSFFELKSGLESAFQDLINAKR